LGLLLSQHGIASNPWPKLGSLRGAANDCRPARPVGLVTRATRVVVAHGLGRAGRRRRAAASSGIFDACGGDGTRRRRARCLSACSVLAASS
jgi:hypothetical protein